jgi:hypothetical protein
VNGRKEEKEVQKSMQSKTQPHETQNTDA